MIPEGQGGPGWTDYTPKEIGEHFGSLVESVVGEWAGLSEVKERENELLRARIEELSSGVAKEAA